METTEVKEKSLNFVEEAVEESIAKGKIRVQTRFPPEPTSALPSVMVACATCVSTTQTPRRRMWSM